MVDFKLNEEQVYIQKVARDYAEKEIKPIASEYDRVQDPVKCFPREVFRKGMELGLHAICIPEKYGGPGMGDFEAVLVSEELGAADAGLATAMIMTMTVPVVIDHFGTPEQKDMWIPAMCEDPDYITGFAVTEHTAGTENWLASEDPKVGVRTTCRREGDQYVINGVKHFITNGGVAKQYGITCRNDLNKPALESTTCFLIPANTSGFSIGKIENKMGQRLMLNGELILSDVTVPKQHRLGDEEKGAAVLIDLTCSTGICIAGAAVGLARAAYEAAVAYANERTSWGQPIIHHQAVAMLLADMKMDMEAARALTWKVAWSSDNKGRDFFSSAAAKVHCADMVQRVASNALQIFGGAGYMRDLPLEKYVRDARVMQIYDGTNQILRVGVGTALASRRR